MHMHRVSLSEVVQECVTRGSNLERQSAAANLLLSSAAMFCSRRSRISSCVRIGESLSVPAGHRPNLMLAEHQGTGVDIDNSTIHFGEALQAAMRLGKKLCLISEKAGPS